MFYFAHNVMGFTEKEFWAMTLRKYIALRDEYDCVNGPPEDKDVFADELEF